MTLRLSLSLFLCIILSACAPPRSEEIRAVAYRCSNGGVISARYDLAGETATLFLPDRTMTLPRAPAATGTRYSDGTFTLWESGSDAGVEFGQTALYDGCKPVRFGSDGGADYGSASGEKGRG